MNDNVARCPHGVDSSVFCDICDENYREELAGSPGGPGPAAAGEPLDDEALVEEVRAAMLPYRERSATTKRLAQVAVATVRAALRSSAPAPEGE